MTTYVFKKKSGAGYDSLWSWKSNFESITNHEISPEFLGGQYGEGEYMIFNHGGEAQTVIVERTEAFKFAEPERL